MFQAKQQVKTKLKIMKKVEIERDKSMYIAYTSEGMWINRHPL